MAKAKDDPRNPSLERAIVEDPEDLGAFQVYADWLQQQGSPRGQLAAVQLARQAADSEELEERESELLAEHAELFLGSHEPASFRGGFWRSLVFDGSVADLRRALRHPSARFLHKLVLGYLDDEEDVNAYDPGIEAVLKVGPLEALRVLQVGVSPEGQSALASFGERRCGNLAKLARACPRLERLRLDCPNFTLGNLPTLRVLDVRMGATPDSVASIARVSLANLEELDLGFETEDSDAMYERLRWSETTLDPLLDGRATPKLRALRLWPMPDGGSSLLERVRSSPLGARLEELDLRSFDDLDEDDTDDE